MSADDLDLYVQRNREPNAYAVGKRSVAVTSGAVEEFRACRMGHEYLEAILCDELGHHRTESTQYVLTAMLARRAVALGRSAGRRHRLGHDRAAAADPSARCGGGRRRAGRGRSVQQGDVATAFTVSSVALCAIVCPLADAAVCRRSEYAADRYAAACGAGPQLASALRAVAPPSSSSTLSWTRRMRSGHPSVDRRLEVLDATVIRPDARPPEVWGSASAWHDTATAAQ